MNWMVASSASLCLRGFVSRSHSSGHGAGLMNEPGAPPTRRLGGGRGAGRGLHLGRGLAAAAAAAMLATVVPALPAAAIGPGGAAAFGLTPAPGSDGLAAAYFKVTVAAGHSAAATALLSNLGTQTEVLKLSRSTGVTAASGGSSYTRAFESCADAGCWVTGLPGKVTLAADSERQLHFTVRVPAGTPDGEYLAGVTAAPAVQPKPVRVGSDGKATALAVIIDEVTIGVAVTVGSLSRLTTQLEIPSVRGAAIGPTARLDIAVVNTGQTFTGGAGSASCTVAGQRHRFTVIAGTLLPQGRAAVIVNVPGFPEGATAPCTVTLGYGKGLTAVWAGSVTVPAPPRERIVHTGNGVYTVLPAATIPLWAIALLVLGVLVLAALALLLLRTRRRDLANRSRPGAGGPA
jgi:hypothetical protein